MYKIKLLISFICACSVGCSQEENRNIELKIAQCTIQNNTLDVVYEIHNNTSHDIWVCYDIPNIHYETFFKNSILTIRFLRRRISEGIYTDISHSSYSCLRQDQIYQNKLQLSIPIKIRKCFDRNAYQNSGGNHLITSNSLELEIGYYDADILSIKGAKKKTEKEYLVPDYMYAEQNTQEKTLKATYGNLEVPCLVK